MSVIKLKNKLLLIFITLSIIPLLIVTFFMYNRYASLIQAQTTQIYTNVLEKSAEEANKQIEGINHISEIFSFYSDTNISIVDNIKQYSNKEKEFTIYDVFQSNQNLKFICQNLIYTNTYINGIFIFTPSDVILGYGYGGNIDVMYDYLPYQDSWYLDTVAATGKTLISEVTKKDFLIGSSPSISFSKALYDVYTGEFLGVLLIDCAPHMFDLSAVNTLSDTMLLSVETAKGSILYSNADDLEFPFLEKETRVNKIPLSHENLLLTSAVNFSGLAKQFGVTQILLVVIAVLCAVFFLIISIIISNSVTAPIANLSRKMAQRTLQSKTTNEKYLARVDEVGILYNEYNNMIDELQKFVKTEYENRLITLDAQMKAMEAQINSHFLFNTLESINSLAEIEENERIVQMSLSLGNMFRYSIKTQSELVSVTEEINHVKDYLMIQSIRFPDKFTVHFEIPDPVLEHKVLKLILQPLIENALFHGVDYSKTDNVIMVQVQEKPGILLFTIMDNGAGIAPEQLAMIRSALEEEPHFTEMGQRSKQSIGLKNIQSRIELYYGKGYGLTVASEVGNGTKIQIEIPLL